MLDGLSFGLNLMFGYFVLPGVHVCTALETGVFERGLRPRWRICFFLAWERWGCLGIWVLFLNGMNKK
jgi:hypothetical protein